MHFSWRKLVTHGLLAVYGGIALLGFGLHELSPVDQLHHVAATCSAHAHSHCAGHSHDASRAPAGLALTDAHECEICVFLAHFCSERPQLAAAIDWQQLVAAVAEIAPRCDSPTILGLAAPRGPPVLAS